MANGSTVLYDACVFYPNHLRDILMQLATTELFAAKWTEQIHDEWTRNLRHNRPDIDTDKLETLKQRINQSVPDCLIKDFEHIILLLDLPDPDDRHVLAAAIASNADVLLTVNLKDFPSSVLAQYEIEAQHPDEFITELLAVKPLRLIQAIRTIQTRLKKPPVSFDEYLEILLRQGLPMTVSMLRQFQSDGA
ncbi:MAG: PIN domain-containing protein [Cyanobacteria bacterium P01_A01_bin.15]